MDSSFVNLSGVNGPSSPRPTTEPAQSRPALLPAFEPLSSSPSLPRPTKRKHDGSPTHPYASLRHYPTPVPTSSTSLLPSSPSRLANKTRPGLSRTVSTVSERVPLGDVPSLQLAIDGEPTMLGRSSNSSQYQLPASRLISRVHVRAWYESPCAIYEHGRIIIECLGWNGMKVLCRGGPIELGKHDTFSSSKPHQDILADIQDTRVMIRWPALAHKSSASALTEQPWEPQDSPTRLPRPDALPSSPPVHLRSPVSPSPTSRLAPTASSTFLGLPFGQPSSPPAVQVYEDRESDNEAAAKPIASHAEAVSPSAVAEPDASQSSSVLSSPPESFSDHEEENDPVIHSFGPFGDNLLPRLASFQAVSPERRRAPLRDSVSPRQAQQGQQSSFSPRRTIRAGKLTVNEEAEMSPIRNHVINQLAFSRLHSLPLGTIMTHLPATLKGPRPSAGDSAESAPLSEARLKQLLDDTPCVGEIVREGKDAAGKPLENEFYYVVEMDADTARKDAVENSLGKPGLRSVRKQHKQYYWKRPRV